MRIWLLKDGENMPVQMGSRPMRTWMIAESLRARGHDVTWWASTFSHQRKQLLFPCDTSCEIQERFRLRLLHAGSYSRNVSLRRYLHHFRLGWKFAQAATQEDRPDAIVCSFPIIEVAYQAMNFARQHAIPIVVDVRDYWPDLYLERIPRWLRSSACAVLGRDFRKTKDIFSGADSLIGISQGILDWALRYAGRSQSATDRVFHTGFPDQNPEGVVANTPLPEFLRGTQGKTVFAFIGTFGSSYDLATICATARQLHVEGFHSAHFVLAGDGDQRSAVEQIVRGLPNVTMTGWLDRAGLRHLAAVADVGLAPCISVRDSMPNKISEYLAAGLPILASLEGEVEHLLAEEQVGFTYAVGDFENLALQVRKLTSGTSLRQAMSQRARELFERRFRAEDIYSEYVKLIEQILESKVSRIEGHHFRAA